MSESEEKVILVKKSKNRDKEPKLRIITALVGFGVGLIFAVVYAMVSFMGVFLTTMGSAGLGSTPELIPLAENAIMIAAIGGFAGILLPVVGLIWGATQYRYSFIGMIVVFLGIGAIFGCMWFASLIYLFSQAPS